MKTPPHLTSSNPPKKQEYITMLCSCKIQKEFTLKIKNVSLNREQVIELCDILIMLQSSWYQKENGSPTELELVDLNSEDSFTYHIKHQNDEQ